MIKRAKTHTSKAIIGAVALSISMQVAAPALAAGPMCADIFKTEVGLRPGTPVAAMVSESDMKALDEIGHETVTEMEARTNAYEANLANLTDSKDTVKRIQNLKRKIEWYRKRNLWWETRDEIETKLSASRFESFLIWNMPDLVRKHFELTFNTAEASGFELMVSKNLIKHLQDEINAGRIDRTRGAQMIAKTTEELEVARETFRMNYLKYRPLRLLLERIQTHRKTVDTNQIVAETYSDLAGITRAQKPEVAKRKKQKGDTPDQFIAVVDLGDAINGDNEGKNNNELTDVIGGADHKNGGFPVINIGVGGKDTNNEPATPKPPVIIPPMSKDQIDRLVKSAKMVDDHFAGFWETQPVRDSFNGIRKTMGHKFNLRRPTLAELDDLYREESNKTAAIQERLTRELVEERKLFVRLMFISPESVDAVTQVITTMSQKSLGKPFVALFKPLLEIMGLSRDAVVRKRYLPTVFEIISMAESPDGMARLNAFRASNIHYKKDQLLVTYARMVNGTETWQQMKDKVEELAYDRPRDANRRVVSQIWANFDARLDAAVEEAGKAGDLALADTVSPHYIGGIVLRAGIPAGAWYAYHSPYFDQAISYLQHLMPFFN
jgi:hypothetical protein